DVAGRGSGGDRRAERQGTRGASLERRHCEGARGAARRRTAVARLSAAEGRASMESKVRQAVTPTIPERLGVGSTIEAKCTKCKAILPHVVVAKIGAVPTRVQCATCSMLHAYSVPRRKARSETEGDVQAAGGAGAWRDALRRARGASVLYS